MALKCFFCVTNFVSKQFIGVTLDKTKATEVWDPDVKPDANDSSHVFRGEHTLLVKQVSINFLPLCIVSICYFFFLGCSWTRST